MTPGMFGRPGLVVGDQPAPPQNQGFNWGGGQPAQPQPPAPPQRSTTPWAV